LPYANVNGIDLYYEEHGVGGPALVLAHGFFGNHAAWYQQIPFFELHYRVVTYDQRGFGLSRDDTGEGRAKAVDDLRALLDHLGIASAALVGHSLGGNVCLSFAVNHPDRVEALVLADSLGGVSLPEDLKRIQEERSRHIAGLPPRQRLLSEQFVQANPAAAELFFQVFSFNQGHNPSTSQGQAPQAITMEMMTAALTEISSLFLVGELDLVQPRELVTSVAQSLQGAELVVVPGAGHSVYFEQPAPFNAEIHSFLLQRLGHVRGAGEMLPQL
jgi:pimeloyl-ACP methyl ester carboxylesterase